MPIHAHYCAKGLEPKRMSETAQNLIASVVMHDRFYDHASQRGHAGGQTMGYLTRVHRQTVAACSSCHSGSVNARSGHVKELGMQVGEMALAHASPLRLRTPVV